MGKVPKVESDLVTAAKAAVRAAVGYLLESPPAGLGLTKERVAADVECSTVAVLYWASGDRVPRPEYRQKLADLAEAHHAPKRVSKTLRSAIEAAEAAARAAEDEARP